MNEEQIQYGKCPRCGRIHHDWSFQNNCDCGCVFIADTVEEETLEIDKFEKKFNSKEKTNDSR